MDSKSSELGFFDCHTHIHHCEPKILEQILNDAKKFMIKHIVCNATNEDEFQFILDLQKQYPDLIIPALGIHPWWLNTLTPGWEERLNKILKENDDAVIGEIGLDNWKPVLSTQGDPIRSIREAIETCNRQCYIPHDNQRDHITLELKKPACVHCVQAHDELLESLTRILGKKSDAPIDSWRPNILFHAFNGNAEYAKKYLELNANLYFSFQPDCLRWVPPLDSIPLENLVIETDSPYLINEKFLKECCVNDIIVGKIQEKDNELLNEPRFLSLFMERLADMMKMKKEDLQKIVFENSKRCFYIN